MLRTGPYGEGFGARPGGLTLDVLLDNPHGVDLGPLASRLREVLRTPTGMVELAPEPIVADVARLRAALDAPVAGMVLVGRRDLRSNNSWMHNVQVLDGVELQVARRYAGVNTNLLADDTLSRAMPSVSRRAGRRAPG
jgi:hypothetical protein